MKGTPATGYALNAQDNSNGVVASIEAQSFAVNTQTMVAKANAPSVNNAGGGHSVPHLNVTYQIAGGGGNLAASNAITLFMWSVDTTAGLSKGVATAARGYGVLGFGDDTGSYAAGGNGGSSTLVDMVSIAVDTANAVVKGSLVTGRFQGHGAMGAWS